MSDRPDHDDDATFEASASSQSGNRRDRDTFDKPVALDGDDLDLDDSQSVRERAYWRDPDWGVVPLPLIVANGQPVTVGGERGLLLIAPGLLVDASTRRRRGLCGEDDDDEDRGWR